MRLFPLLFLLACGPRLPSATGTPSGQPTGTPAGSTSEPTSIRVATWNVQSLGAAGSAEHDALIAVLTRIDADVVGLNELEGLENAALQSLAADLGYDTVVVPDSNPFGDLHNAVLARVAISSTAVLRSPDLSGDPQANDVTRWPVSITLPSGLTIVANHCKSGFDDEDEFRRTVDAIRMTQAPGDPTQHVVMGDINQEVDETQDQPVRFTDFPVGMPGSYYLGADLYAEMTGSGLHNGPFPHFADAGLTVVEALQLDGRPATRPSSGRQIDYVLVGSGVVDRILGSEVYNSREDGPNAGGLPKAGEAPERTTSEIASDHLPVLVDIQL